MSRARAALAVAGLLGWLGALSACDGDNRTPPASAGPGSGGAGASGGSSGSAGAEPAAECIGPLVSADVYGVAPGPLIGAGGAGGAGGSGGAALGPTEIGSDAPVYQLHDFQPLSCGFLGTYGLEPFKGKVTIAALWAGW